MTKPGKTRAAPNGEKTEFRDEAAAPKSKKDQLIELLRRDRGASLDEMTTATGWQPHTARAMLTTFRKKGHNVTRAKIDGVTRYAIIPEPRA